MAGKETAVLDRLELDGNAVAEVEELKLALSERHSNVSSERIVSGDETATRGGVEVIHERSRKIRLYKREGGARMVPAEQLDRLLDPKDGGWALRCYVCGTDCGGAPWGCGKAPKPKFWQCPVATCNTSDGRGGPKIFWEKPFVMTESDNPDRLTDELLEKGKVSMARAQMYAHVWAFHPDFAAAASIPRS